MSTTQHSPRADPPASEEYLGRMLALQARICNLETRDFTPCNCPLDCLGPTGRGRASSNQPRTPQRVPSGLGSGRPPGAAPGPLPALPPRTPPNIPPPAPPQTPVRSPNDGPRARDGTLHPVVNLRIPERETASIFAEARGTKPNIQLRRTGDTGTLRMSLQVHSDEWHYRSRLGYYGELYLTTPGQRERHVGFISGWRISRSSGQHPNGTPLWVTDWLQSDLTSDADDAIKQSFRMLFDRDGNPNDFGRLVPDLDSVLGDDSDIIYIPMIWISTNVSVTILTPLRNLTRY